MTPTQEKLRAGLYRIVGMTCNCGGELRIEKFRRGDFRWETFCTRCKTCDPNGWSSRAQCLRAAVEYFSARPELKATVSA